jgi:hypothetical protein
MDWVYTEIIDWPVKARLLSPIKRYGRDQTELGQMCLLYPWLTVSPRRFSY